MSYFRFYKIFLLILITISFTATNSLTAGNQSYLKGLEYANSRMVDDKILDIIHKYIQTETIRRYFMNQIKLKSKHNIFNMKESIQISDSEISDMKKNYDSILSVMMKQGVAESSEMNQYLDIIQGKEI